MPDHRKNAPGIGGHANGGTEQTITAKGRKLLQNAFIVIVIPPGRAKLNFALNAILAKGAGEGGKHGIICRIEGI